MMQSVTILGAMVAVLATGLVATSGTVAAHARGTAYPRTQLARRTLGDEKSDNLSRLLAQQESSSSAAAAARYNTNYPPAGSSGQGPSTFRTQPNPGATMNADDPNDEWAERFDQANAFVRTMQTPPSNAELSNLLAAASPPQPPAFVSKQAILNDQNDLTPASNANIAKDRLRTVQQHLDPSLQGGRASSPEFQQAPIQMPQEDFIDSENYGSDDFSLEPIYDDMPTSVEVFKGPGVSQISDFDSMIHSLSSNTRQTVNGGLNNARISMDLLERILVAIQRNPLQQLTGQASMYQSIINTALQAIPNGGLSQVMYNIFFVDVLCSQLLHITTGTLNAELTQISDTVKQTLAIYKELLIKTITEIVQAVMKTSLSNNAQREYLHWSVSKAFNQHIPFWGDLMGSWLDIVEPSDAAFNSYWPRVTGDVLDMYFIVMSDGRKEILKELQKQFQNLPKPSL